MRRFIIPAMAAVLLAGSAQDSGALGFLDLATGDEGLLPDARSAALGRTRLAETTGGFTGRSNPALLSRVKHPVATVGGNVLKMEETREIPAFDSFDGFLVESIYAYNDRYQWEMGAGVAAGYDLGDYRIGVGLSLAPVRDFQYDYSEEVRDPNAFTQPRDRLLALNEVNADGRLDAWTIAAGVEVLPSLNLGASLEFLRGHQDVILRTRYVQEDREEGSKMSLRSMEGRRIVVGGAYHPDPAVSVAGTWTAAVGLGLDALNEGDQTRLFFLGDLDGQQGSQRAVITYPQEVKIGAVYRPRAGMRTNVQLDIGWTEWSEYENSLLAMPGLTDVWDGRAGIEHIFYNGVPVRFGFRWAPSPVNDEIATTAFTFGGGFHYASVRTDIAFEVANRQYRFDDLFDDSLFGGNSRIQKDRVEESSSSMFVTVTYDYEQFGG